MFIIAHRGFRSPNGENRLLDFENALKITKGVEFDIRLTQDKQVIIFHDDDLHRIAGDKRLVRDLTYSQIQKLPFFIKHPQSLPPLLEEFRTKIAHQYVLINIEIKDDDYGEDDLQLLLQAIKKFRDFRTEIVVSSFSKKIQTKIFELDHRFKKGYLFTKMANFEETWAQKFDYLHPPLVTINRLKNVAYFAKMNIPMHPWTYKHNRQAQKTHLYYRHLIHGYISDKSDLEY